MDRSNPQLDKNRSLSQYLPAILSSQCVFSCFKATVFEVNYIYCISWDLNLKQRHGSDKAQSQGNIAEDPAWSFFLGAAVLPNDAVLHCQSLHVMKKRRTPIQGHGKLLKFGGSQL